MKRFKRSGSGQEPTQAELAVLQVIWKEGPSTVRTVHEALNLEGEPVQYTSTLKLMQVMTEKGMLSRDETNMKHVYSAVLKEKDTKGQLLDRIIDNLYQGDVGKMMVALLGNEKTSEEDLQKVKELLTRMEKGQK